MKRYTGHEIRVYIGIGIIFAIACVQVGLGLCGYFGVLEIHNFLNGYVIYAGCVIALIDLFIHGFFSSK